MTTIMSGQFSNCSKGMGYGGNGAVRLITNQGPPTQHDDDFRMTEAVTVRSAMPSDSPRLAELSGVLGYPVAADLVSQRLERLLSRAEEGILVAELTPGWVIGWVHGSEQVLLESGRRCEILGLVVDPEHRGKGVGRRLVTSLERWAADRGLDQIAVRSNVLRVESHPFYERLGYVRAKTQHAYRKRLSPT
jgi:GNAT superfamily N-acetyltransferase